MKLDFNVVFLILIGLGCGLISFGIFFPILKPNDNKVAIKLDQKFNLQEKVQTMIEYQNEEGFIVELQRKDTKNILSKIPVKSLTMRFSAILFIFLGLSLACSITAIAVSNDDAKDPTDVIIDPGYEIDDWTIIALKDLIKYVEDSSINDSLKGDYVSELNNLLDTLKDSSKESQMKEAVLSSIDTMQLKLDIINTNNEIFEVLKSANHMSVVNLAYKIRDLDINAINNSLDGFITAIGGSIDGINEVDVSFGQILKTSTINKEDEAYKLLLELNSELVKCKSQADIYNAVKNVIAEKKGPILEAFTKQYENQAVTDYVLAELQTIFGLKENSGGEDKPGDNPGGDSNDDPVTPPLPNDKDYTGGYGTGEVIIGSNDSMFDPNQGKVEFKDVISDYQNDILGRFDEGRINEELKEYFEYYYDILFGTLEE